MDDNLKRYDEIRNPSFRIREKKVSAFIPSPTEGDYKTGFITRYIIQKQNDKGAPIYEVNSQEYAKLIRNTFFGGVVLKWRISGPLRPIYDGESNEKDKGILESNRISIQLHRDKIPNLKMYLGNLRQFYKN